MKHGVWIFLLWIGAAMLGMGVAHFGWHNGVPARWTMQYETVDCDSCYLGKYYGINDSVDIRISEGVKTQYDKMTVWVNKRPIDAWTYVSIHDSERDAIWYLAGKYDDYIQNKKSFYND